MHKGHQLIVGTLLRHFVYETNTHLTVMCQHSVNVCDLDAKMVDPLAPFPQETAYWALWIGGLQEFEMALANAEEGGFDLLLGDLFYVTDRLTEQPFVKGQGRR